MENINNSEQPFNTVQIKVLRLVHYIKVKLVYNIFLFCSEKQLTLMGEKPPPMLLYLFIYISLSLSISVSVCVILSACTCNSTIANFVLQFSAQSISCSSNAERNRKSILVTMQQSNLAYYMCKMCI